MIDRHFLQENLPRIRYNNPSIEYEVYKTLDASTKPTIAVHFCKFCKADPRNLGTVC